MLPKKEGHALRRFLNRSLSSTKVKFFNIFWNACRDFLCLFDENLNFLDINKAALKEINIKKRDVIGKNILEIFPHLKGTDRLDKYREVIKTGKPLFIKTLPDPLINTRSLFVLAFKVPTGLGMVVFKNTPHKGELADSYQVLRSLSSHYQVLREEESRRIAREIHDEMAPTLTTFKMDLYWVLSKLRAEAKPGPLIEKKFDEMADLVDKTVSSIRKICSELRPALLDDLGLFDAMEWHVQEYQKRSNIKCRLNIDCDCVELSPDLSLCIFRVFQEAFTNIIRHANATKAFVSLKQIPAKKILVLKIRDNGRGISQEEIANPRSFGLIGIQERLSLYDGRLKIKGIPDKGTTLMVSIPLTRKMLQDERHPA